MIDQDVATVAQLIAMVQDAINIALYGIGMIIGAIIGSVIMQQWRDMT